MYFRHEASKEMHAPGLFLHITPEECSVAVGIWRPNKQTLNKIREAIVMDDQAWLAARNNQAFNKCFSLRGDWLKNSPWGFARDLPLIDDIKRKDFMAVAKLDKEVVVGKALDVQVLADFETGGAFVSFLCKALGLRY